jgi:hypothetical protein
MKKNKIIPRTLKVAEQTEEDTQEALDTLKQFVSPKFVLTSDEHPHLQVRGERVRPIAKLLIYSSKQTTYMTKYFLDFILNTNLALTSLDGFKLGICAENFQYYLRCLRDRVAGMTSEYTTDDIRLCNKFVLMMERYEGLIDFLIESYDTFLQDTNTDHFIELNSGYVSQFKVHHFHFTQEEKEEIYQSINKIELPNLSDIIEQPFNLISQ